MRIFDLLNPENNSSNPEIQRVHNLIILDESGSMNSIYRPALTGVNETLQTIRNGQAEHADQRHFVTLVAFDSGHYNEIYANTAADKAMDITEKQYRPGGCTPLYDAMGRAITTLRKEVREGDAVLVTVITDGYENASHEYDRESIRRMVEELKKQNWLFTYIGANQDVEAVSKSLAIDNNLEFCCDEASTHEMFDRENRSRSRWFARLSDKVHTMFVDDYFITDDEDDKV